MRGRMRRRMRSWRVERVGGGLMRMGWDGRWRWRGCRDAQMERWMRWRFER